MSLNLYGLIIKAAEENNTDMTLERIGRINDSISNLIASGVCKEWIENNISILF